MKDKDSWVKVELRDNNLTKGDHFVLLEGSKKRPVGIFRRAASVSGSYLPALILAMIALMESVM